MNFSVLLSIYSKEDPNFLTQSLNSVFNQSVNPSEVIVVEDGPLTPELYSVLSEFEICHQNLRRVKLPKNSGLGNALNEGLKYCTYDLVARMDTDDIALPDRFEKQLKVFETYPQVAAVSSWIDEFEETPDSVISTRKLPEFHIGYSLILNNL